MNIQQLECFVQVAEHLNFARAAEALNITQPAVSRQISSLESELNTRLFLRTTRSVFLTPTGSVFLEDAKDILGKLYAATERIQSRSGESIRPLFIGCCNEADLNWFSILFSGNRIKFPDVHPLIRIIPQRAILNLFVQGELDILFGFQEDIPARNGIRYRELFLSPICCALPKEHPWSGLKEITEEMLLQESMIVCRMLSALPAVDLIQNRLMRKYPPSSIYRCESGQAAAALVQAGYGFALLPKILPYASSNITYVPLHEAGTISYGLFYKAGEKDTAVKNWIASAAFPTNPEPQSP